MAKIQDKMFNRVIEGELLELSDADNSAVAGALAGLDIAPKNVNATGSVTGDSIIENMSGYTFVKNPNGPYTLAYVGVCKNGNKITFVIAGTLNFPDVSQIYNIGNFVIPEAIGQKLYPITGTQIAFLSINAQLNYASRITVSGIFNKNSNSNIDVRIYGSGLTANTDYYFRIEQTFLLSDNLAE